MILLGFLWLLAIFLSASVGLFYVWFMFTGYLRSSYIVPRLICLSWQKIGHRVLSTKSFIIATSPQLKPIGSNEKLEALPLRFPFGVIKALIGDPIEFGKEIYSKSAKTGLVISWFFNSPRVYITNPILAKDLLSASDREYIRPTAPQKLIAKLFGKSVLAASGEDWQRQHRLLYKAFAPKNVRLFDQVMEEEAELLVEKLLSSKGSVAVGAEMQNLALRIVTRIAFAFESGDDPRLNTIMSCFATLIKTAESPLTFLSFFENLPIKSARDVKASFQTLHRLAAEIVNERRDKLNAGQISSDRTFLLDLLIEARDEENGREVKLSDDELRDNVIVFLIAGSETTAWTMTWFLYFMTQNPDVLAKLRKDLETSNSSETLAYESTDKKAKSYFEKCVSETLRVACPVSFCGARQFPQARTFGGYSFPALIRALVHIAAMHRNPEHWNNPDKFDPDNFSEELSCTRHPYAFLPFGAGRRLCIGRTFALEEIAVVLPKILKRLDFCLAPGFESVKPMGKAAVTHVLGDLHLVFAERQSQ